MTPSRWETLESAFRPHMHSRTSSTIFRKGSRSAATPASLPDPRPRTSVLVSSGFLVVMALAIWEAYSWPIISRCGVPAPSSDRGVKRAEGRSASSVDEESRGAVSTWVGLSLERGTWIYKSLAMPRPGTERILYTHCARRPACVIVIIILSQNEIAITSVRVPLISPAVCFVRAG